MLLTPPWETYLKQKRNDPMKHTAKATKDVETLLRPETNLERTLLKTPAFQKGLFWGEPRFGHPEGKVLYHIREVLDNVDKLNVSPKMRTNLRLVTLLHDTFKYAEIKTKPRNWKAHHGILARRFFEQYSNDKTVLTMLEWHDEAYFAWRAIHVYQKPEKGKERLNNLLKRLGDDLQLFYLFFKCDTQTGDKIQAPVTWFEKTVKDIEIVSF